MLNFQLIGSIGLPLFLDRLDIDPDVPEQGQAVFVEPTFGLDGNSYHVFQVRFGLTGRKQKRLALSGRASLH